MGDDVLSLAAEVMPYAIAAAGAYGAAVLAKVRDETADATVGLGRRLLQRLFGSRREGEPLPGALADLASDPGDADAQAAVRLMVRKLLAADLALASEVRSMLAAAQVNVIASGKRSVAGQVISGVVVTGDDAVIRD